MIPELALAGTASPHHQSLPSQFLSHHHAQTALKRRLGWVRSGIHLTHQTLFGGVHIFFYGYLPIVDIELADVAAVGLTTIRVFLHNMV